MIVRELRCDETELLKDFLYEAIFIPEGIEPPEEDCDAEDFYKSLVKGAVKWTSP